MNCLEKRHVSHKAGMQYLGYLDNFMDETDREVMSLTDRAFKSLCIGDEAIYNDSEFSPSPVSCQKPLAEEVPKKTQENCSLTVKKHPLNGVIGTSWQFNKDSSLFAAFAPKKNGDTTKVMNGDSWDKSALLSIQRELSEFSTDYHKNLADEHASQVKNHLKSSEKSNKSSKDTSTQSGKSGKSKHSKSSKLRKLNSKNFFLHSELSPFQSWRDLNKFPFELDNIEIFQSNRPPEWYDSPLYKKLTMSHRLHAPESNKQAQCCNTSRPEVQDNPDAKISQRVDQTLKTMPLKVERYTENSQPEMHVEAKPQVLRASSSSEQRCQSEGDPCAPWRKNRSRAKSAVPVGQPSSLACERAKTSEEGVLPNKKEVRTMEEQASSSSTPFNLLQLLTPVVPSRQGTGSSEILQAVLSPSTLDLPSLPETEMRPSPEIKREGYKSKASSLLFNLKDNRKRVKATYSPPKFKGVDPADQNRLSPLIEQVVTKNGLEVPEIPDAKVTSPLHRRADVSPISPYQETTDLLNLPPSEHISGGFPDDYLGLCLLQDGSRGSPIKPLRSNKSSVANKVTYPSLSLYRKVNPTESDAKTTPTLAMLSHPSADKNTIKAQNMDGRLATDGKELQTNLPPIHVTKPADGTNWDSSDANYSKTTRTAGKVQTDTIKDKYPLAVRKNHNPRSDTSILLGSRNQDKGNMGETGKTEQKDEECLRKETKPKRLFSARQNNYIKSQRYASVDEGQDENGGEEVALAGRDHNNDGVPSRTSGSSHVGEGRKGKQNVGVHKAKEAIGGKPGGTSVREGAKKDALSIKDDAKVLGACSEEGVNKNDALSMKGNTSAKRAMFAVKERALIKNAVAPRKDDVLMDKYELAKAALEEVIAEREQRKKQSQVVLSTGGDDGEGFKRLAGTDLAMQEDYKQVDRLAVSQNDTVVSATKERRGGQKGTFDLKSRSRSVSERDTKHGKSHVAEVNLAGPCKQEGAAEDSQHTAGQIKYIERDGSGRRRQSETVQVKPMGEVTEPKEKVPVPKNMGSRVANAEGMLARQSEELAVHAKSTSYKPEVPPRRGRANSQSDTERREEAEGGADKNEDSISREVKKVKPSPTKERGPVRGHVSALKEKFDQEQGTQSINVQDFMSQGEGPEEDPKMHKTKQKEIAPEMSVCNPASETVPTKCIHDGTGIKSDKDSKEIKTNENYLLSEKDSVGKKENKRASEALRADNHEKPKDHRDSDDKELFSGLERTEEVKPDGNSENEITRGVSETSESLLNSIIVYDILKQSESPSLSDPKQEQCLLPSVSSKESTIPRPTEESLTQPESDLTSQKQKCEEILVPTSEPCVPDQVVSSPSDMEKGGWVRCLIESARNLTPTSQSNASSPTMGKPALFKVKDNTFSSSPVTKSVRPIFHKNLSEFSQPWSPRESLSGSEKGEQDIFKDSVELQSPTILSPTPPSTPAQSPQASLSSMHLLSPPASQFSASRGRKGQLDSSLSVPEEDEMRSAVSSVSEGIESCGTSVGDTGEDAVFLAVPSEDAEESKAPSERSESACSGLESQTQGKPPTVPPKTEKALRRAMKLTTRRIQKAEAKSKPERQGRGSEKSAGHKPERRYHSTDSRPGQRGHSVEQGDAKSSNERLLRKTHRSERHAREEKAVDPKREEENRGNRMSRQAEAKHRAGETQSEEKFEHKGHMDARHVDAHCERQGRSSVKYLPDRLDRRAHSLDRFASDTPELGSISRMSGEPSKGVGTSKRAPLRQGSVDHAYASAATNIVAQSFPMTQRRLLQDPDSGQYFVVDMPVQVKTKTFFDPETGSYVQLPVQSPDASVAQAQPMEVVNAPPLVLYHGFVPVPIPAQKPAFKVGPVITPEDLDKLESSEKRRAVGQPYVESGHVPQEHLAEQEAEIVR